MISRQRSNQNENTSRVRAEELVAKIRRGAVQPAEVNKLVSGATGQSGVVTITIDGKRYTATPVQ